MKWGLSAVANGIVSACALTGLGVLLGRGVTRTAAPAGPPVPEAAEVIEQWAEMVAGSTLVGDAGAPVVLLTFSDFQCPYCGELARLVADLRRERPGSLRMAYRHFPLESIHPHAQAAALAAECAAEEVRFEAMHDVLFDRQDRIGSEDWVAFAREAGVTDSNAFSRCMAESRHLARVRADVAAGEELGVTGTPTVYLNGRRMPTGLSKDALRRRIAAAIQD